MHIRLTCRQLCIAPFVSLALLMAGAVSAQFVMDFTPDTGMSMITSSYQESRWVQRSIPGQTPFLSDGMLPEVVTDGNGNEYYHLITGALQDGFIQEVYILRSPAFGTNWNGSAGTSNSASLGSANTCCQESGVSSGGNGGNPFGVLNTPIASGGTNHGNGSAFPNRVLVRQLLNTNDITQEFTKAQFDTKPRVNQILVTPELISYFDMDMGNSTYTDDTQAATVFNFQELASGSAPQASGDFQMFSDGTTTSIIAGGRATQDQRDRVTGGRYVYDYSTGSSRGGGNYIYVDNVIFDHTSLDWEGYFDPNTHNPWTFEFNKPVK